MYAGPLKDGEVMTTEWGFFAAAQLANHFGIVAPSFRFNKTRRGLYYPSRKEVTVPRPNADRRGSSRTSEHSFVHEFAHHLADERVLQEWNRRGGLSWERPETPKHNSLFRIALLDVATVFYGDPKKYAWATEYKNIQAWSERRGLLVRCNQNRPSVFEKLGFFGGTLAVRMAERADDATGTRINPTVPVFKTLGTIRRVRKVNPPFDTAECVRMYESGERITDIARKLANGRALGHTGNVVRQTLTTLGIYRKPERRSPA